MDKYLSLFGLFNTDEKKVYNFCLLVSVLRMFFFFVTDAVVTKFRAFAPEKLFQVILIFTSIGRIFPLDWGTRSAWPTGKHLTIWRKLARDIYFCISDEENKSFVTLRSGSFRL
jgi:hypothetical protein